MDFDELYLSHDNYFGAGPDRLLLDYYHLINSKKPLLDLGAGQGRHSIYLAREGYTVHALDPSKVALNTIYEISKAEHLPLRTIISSFEAFDFRTDYSAVLIFGLIQLLSWSSIEILIEKLSWWAKPGCLLFITAFSTADPTFELKKSECESVGKNSFRGANNRYYTYLEPNEILSLFPHTDVVYHWEGIGSEHRHGDRPVHKHGLVHVVLER